MIKVYRPKVGSYIGSEYREQDEVLFWLLATDGELKTIFKDGKVLNSICSLSEIEQAAVRGDIEVVS